MDLCNLNNELITLKQALALIDNTISPLTEHEEIPITQALGRICADDIISPINLPPERNSAMDGYAFNSHFILATPPPHTLKIIGTAWAGKPFLGSIQTDECVRIFTGAIIPDSADSVVMQEQVIIENNGIRLPLTIKPFQCIREAGCDIQANTTIISANKTLNAADLGLIAAIGQPTVKVIRPLKVAFFTTGDELLSISQPLVTGKIYDSNRYTLLGLLESKNISANDLGVIPDNLQLISKLLKSQSQEKDVIICTGGASVGEADYIYQILFEFGEIIFWKVAIKPGKPIIFAKLGKCYIFGLPGNPGAVITTFNQLVNPALNKLCNAKNANKWYFNATTKDTLTKEIGRIDFQRGFVYRNEVGVFEVMLTGGQNSNQLKPYSVANCFIVLPEDSNGVEAGDKVTVQLFNLCLR